MLFSESAPPAAKPKVPATPFTLASTPPWEALVVRYPSPRSGRMKPPKCRCRVSGNWVVDDPGMGVGAFGGADRTERGRSSAGAAPAFSGGGGGGSTH